MRVLITGISSSLGYYTAKALLKKGYFVGGLSRSIPKNCLEKTQYYSCDITDYPKVSEISQNYDTIIHMAALSSPWGKKKDFFKINEEGTKNLLKAALKQGVKRFIFISSPSIYFEYKDQFYIEEAALSNKPVNDYAASKQAAEKWVDQASQMGLETFILRPKAIFGPKDRVLIPRMIHAIQSKGIPRFFKEDILVDITYVENVADAIVLAVQADSKYAGSKYNITNDEPVLLHQAIAKILQQIGYPYRERKIPYPLAKFIAFFSEKISFITHKEPLLTRYTVGALSFSQTLCIAKAKKELGYEPKVSIEEGMNRYKKWWYENN